MIASIPIPGTDPGLVTALSGGGLPLDDVTEPGRVFFRFERAGALLGHGGFELYRENALLRSVVVPKEHRGIGAGRIIVESLLREIAEAGGKRAFLLTTAAASFFNHLGFVEIDREMAPASILATRQASSMCSSATLLLREI